MIMGRKLSLICDFCGKEMTRASGKVYLCPILPGKSLTSFQSSYTHSGDVCDECIQELIEKLTPRKSRSENGRVTPLREAANG